MLEGGAVEGEDRTLVACPTCTGPLGPEAQDWVCRVGHRFTVAEVAKGQTEAINRALWYSLRAVEDRAIVNDLVAGDLEREGGHRKAARLRSQIVEDLVVVGQLHGLVGDLATIGSGVEREAGDPPGEQPAMGSHS